MSTFKPTKVVILREAITKVTQILAGKRIRVVQRGMMAKVEYDMRTKLPVAVYLPMLPDDASNELCDAIQGFLDHEVAHILFTDPTSIAEAAKFGAQGASINNMVEDAFIERRMAETFKGSGSNLASTGNFYLKSFVEPNLKAARDKGDMKEEVSVLFPTIIRALSGQFIYKEALKRFGSAAADAIYAKLEDLEPKLAAIQNSMEGVAVTKEILDRLKSKDEQPQPQNQSQDQDDQDGDSDDKQDNDKEGKSKKQKPDDKKDEQDGEGDQDEQDKDEQDKDEQDGDQDGEPEEGEGQPEPSDEGSQGDGEPEPSDEAGEGEPEQGDEAGEGGEGEPEDGEGEGEGEPEDGEGEAGDQDGGSDDGQPSDGDQDGDITDMENSLDSGEVPDTSNGNEHELPAGLSWEEIAAAAADAGDYDDATAKVMGDMAANAAVPGAYLPFTTEEDEIKVLEVPASSRDRFIEACATHVEAPVSAMVGPMQKDLERAIAARSAAVYVGGHRSGRLNGSALTRLKFNDDRVFRRKEENHTKDVVAQLVVDISGSMGGSPVLTAARAAFALSSVLERIRIKHEVICFTTGRVLMTAADVVDAQRKRILYSRTENIVMPIIKSFHEPMNSDVRARFGALPTEMPMCCNIDGESIEYAARRLVGQKASRHVMIVLSDGQPAGHSMQGREVLVRDLKHRVKKLEGAGIDIVAIGIESSAPREFYPKHVILNDMQDLPATVIKQLRGLLIPK